VGSVVTAGRGAGTGEVVVALGSIIGVMPGSGVVVPGSVGIRTGGTVTG
jgi:hypothetical protein